MDTDKFIAGRIAFHSRQLYGTAKWDELTPMMRGNVDTLIQYAIRTGTIQRDMYLVRSYIDGVLDPIKLDPEGYWNGSEWQSRSEDGRRDDTTVAARTTGVSSVVERTHKRSGGFDLPTVCPF